MASVLRLAVHGRSAVLRLTVRWLAVDWSAEAWLAVSISGGAKAWLAITVAAASISAAVGSSIHVSLRVSKVTHLSSARL